MTIYADIESHTTGGGTIPLNIITTSKKPVLFWSNDKRVVLFELSVPFEPNITKAHQTKLDRYATFLFATNPSIPYVVYEY